MSGLRKAQKGNPPQYDDEARWREVDRKRDLDEEAPDADRHGSKGLTKNPGDSGTQGTRDATKDMSEREHRE